MLPRINGFRISCDYERLPVEVTRRQLAICAPANEAPNPKPTPKMLHTAVTTNLASPVDARYVDREGCDLPLILSSAVCAGTKFEHLNMTDPQHV
jgi:hypothetical protein